MRKGERQKEERDRERGRGECSFANIDFEEAQSR